MRTDLSTSSDLHATVTQKIITAIEAGADTFVMPWHRRADVGRPTNASTTKAYRGINVVGLWAESVLTGYSSGYWASYRQWMAAGAQVRRGERGTVVVFYKALEPGADNEPDRPARRVLRSSYVFNLDQVEGWNEPRAGADEVSPHAGVDDLVQASRANVEHGGDIACFVPARDLIKMPDRSAFRGSPTSSPTEAYYSTLLHELVHWTGAKPRLDRSFDAFGTATYAFEELVAELGAAFLCADLRVTNEPRPDHAAYIKSWLEILERDHRAIFKAASAADKAAQFLTDFA